MRVRDATASDWPAIVAIFNQVIASSVAIFELQPYTMAERAEWFAQFGAIHPLLVCDEGDGGGILGFAYYLPYRTRPAYAATKEVTVYTRDDARRRGVASRLYAELIERACSNRVHVLIAVLGGENPESRALHAKFGFEPAGHLHAVGFKFGRWVDTYYYEKILDP